MLLPSFNWPQHDCFDFAEAEGRAHLLEQPLTRISSAAGGGSVRPEEPLACKSMQKEGWVSDTNSAENTNKTRAEVAPLFKCKKNTSP